MAQLKVTRLDLVGSTTPSTARLAVARLDLVATTAAQVRLKVARLDFTAGSTGTVTLSADATLSITDAGQLVTFTATPSGGAVSANFRVASITGGLTAPTLTALPPFQARLRIPPSLTDEQVTIAANPVGADGAVGAEDTVTLDILTAEAFTLIGGVKRPMYTVPSFGSAPVGNDIYQDAY